MNRMRDGLLVAAVVLLAGCGAQIQHGLDERDANEIVSVLVARGFDARKTPEKNKKPSWAIEVDDQHATDALRVLTELKLPRPRRLTTQDVAAQTSLIETPATERLRQLEAQEGDLEQGLETMDGVTSAAVELVVPLAPRPGQPAMPSKASVLLRAQPESVERLQQQRGELRALVAASVDGLKPDDVVLVIDVVTTQVSSPMPVKAESSLRVLVLALGALLSVLAGLLVVLTLRLRRANARPGSRATVERVPTPQPLPAAVPPRPLVAAHVQRKVA